MGVTVLSVRRWLPEHFLLGFLLIPPLALKMASTGYRFVRYYAGDPQYRRAGPPELLMRLTAPIVVICTLAIFATGIELWLFGLRFGSIWVEAHKLSFYIWLPAAAVHILGHLGRTGQAAGEELSDSRSRSALTRRSLVVGSLVAGVVLATFVTLRLPDRARDMERVYVDDDSGADGTRAFPVALPMRPPSSSSGTVRKSQ